MSDDRSSGCAGSVGGAAVLLILLGLFIGGSMLNRIRITRAIQKDGATTMGSVTDTYDRFYAVPFIEYTYTANGSTFVKEASLLGVANYAQIRPGDPLQISYLRSRPGTALPTLRVGVSEREQEASVVCGVVPLGLGLILLLGLMFMRPREPSQDH